MLVSSFNYDDSDQQKKKSGPLSVLKNTMMAAQQQQQPQAPNSPASFWSHAKEASKRVSISAQKAKLRAEVALVDQKIQSLKHQMGIQLYDYLVTFAEQEPYFVVLGEAPDGTKKLDNIQGLFVKCWKDNCALYQKLNDKRDELKKIETERHNVNSRHGGTLSFDVPADSVGERILNAPKNAQLMGSETKVKVSISVAQNDIKRNKQTFGVECYDLFVKLQKEQKWLPTDTYIKAIYEQTRIDAAPLELSKTDKIQEMQYLE